MRRNVVMILFLALIGGAAYLYFFQWEWVQSLFHEAQKKVAGYEKGTTPEKTASMFVKAVKKRDFTTAADYCGGRYKEMLLKVADKASRLGNQIDHLTEKMGNSGNIDSDKVKSVLMLLDPFPTDIKYTITEDKKNAEERAFVTFANEKPLPNVANLNWTFKKIVVFRALVVSLGGQKVPIVRDKDGEKLWKIQIPVTPEVEVAVQELEKKGTSIAATLKNIDDTVVNDRTPRIEFENKFYNDMKEVLE